MLLGDWTVIRPARRTTAHIVRLGLLEKGLNNGVSSARAILRMVARLGSDSSRSTWLISAVDTSAESRRARSRSCRVRCVAREFWYLPRRHPLRPVQTAAADPAMSIQLNAVASIESVPMLEGRPPGVFVAAVGPSRGTDWAMDRVTSELAPGEPARARFPIFDRKVTSTSCSQVRSPTRCARRTRPTWAGGVRGSQWDYWVACAEQARRAFASVLHAQPTTSR